MLWSKSLIAISHQVSYIILDLKGHFFALRESLKQIFVEEILHDLGEVVGFVEADVLIEVPLVEDLDQEFLVREMLVKLRSLHLLQILQRHLSHLEVVDLVSAD